MRMKSPIGVLGIHRWYGPHVLARHPRSLRDLCLGAERPTEGRERGRRANTTRPANHGAHPEVLLHPQPGEQSKDTCSGGAVWVGVPASVIDTSTE